MSRVLLRAVVASLVVAVVATVVLFLTAHKAGIPRPGVEVPSEFYSWSAHKQNEWRVENLELVGGVAYIRERMKYPAAFAAEFALSAGSIFVVGVASCLLFVFLGGLRSNSTVERDARKSGARPSP